VAALKLCAVDRSDTCRRGIGTPVVHRNLVKKISLVCVHLAKRPSPASVDGTLGDLLRDRHLQRVRGCDRYERPPTSVRCEVVLVLMLLLMLAVLAPSIIRELNKCAHACRQSVQCAHMQHGVARC
jgi:hypothetical protein